METITDPRSMQQWSDSVRAKSETIGLVPTMGYLHEGHLSLVREAKRHSDHIVASIFVNPLQFGVNEDLDAYPRDIENDSFLLDREGVEVLFSPGASSMYPEGVSDDRKRERSYSGFVWTSSSHSLSRGDHSGGKIVELREATRCCFWAQRLSATRSH